MNYESATTVAPLRGIRVLNLGGIWAGRVAAMLLSDQGADVIELNRSQRIGSSEDALLSRGKRCIELDFGIEHQRAEAFRLACNADIVIDNLGAGKTAVWGLDYASVSKYNPEVVYLSLPGFASGTLEAELPAWEGSLAASHGVYSHLNSTAAILGSDPIFTSVPMASAYGGVLGATVATLAFFHRLRSGAGQFVEVPLADAVLSSMSALAMRIEGQPEQFNLPRVDNVMKEIAFPIFRDLADHLSDQHKAALSAYLKRFSRPQFGHHLCADGRLIFINAADHVHQARACLDVLGILDQLVAEGMFVGSPFDEGVEGNNISSSVQMNPHWVARLNEVMVARFLTRSAGEWQEALQVAGVPCSIVRTTEEWLLEPVAHESGHVSEIDDPIDGPVLQAGRFLTITGTGTASPTLTSRSVEKYEVGSSWQEQSPINRTEQPPMSPYGPILEGIRILDISNIIAAPVASRTLAEFGAQVIRIDAPAPQAGPRMTMWYGIDVNQGKRAAIIDLKTDQGRQVLKRLVENADIVVHNFLDKSAPGLGISYEQLRTINPNIICCQVSAWGGPNDGAWKDFPAFDPVLQAATGITSRYGTPNAPVLHGIASCVDYIAGFTAALGIAQALVAKELGRGGAYVRTSLVMGAQLVQFPFVVASASEARPTQASGQDAKGHGAQYSLYRCVEGWAFLACRERDLHGVAAALGAKSTSRTDMADSIALLSIGKLHTVLNRFPKASVVKVKRLDALPVVSREDDKLPPTVALDFGNVTLVRRKHPSNFPTALLAPSWFRLTKSPVRELVPAPAPGTHTRDVLVEIGLSKSELNALYASGVVHDRWQVLKYYLPK
ncbi:CoA transferase [Caballeronia sp. SEWSISQ10-4 2]|uniref:CoA transferase n=1 Tax=Caballeronia sp. SEWSISQ10-4 2 TaxID=2937438 RepID=UPI0026540E19|nr:CoA transferase [Caballeronia sp. SEWSISQ10-4 2]MDN7179238.1 CoA transferase [Caballeronia sp. SEWSISQ10-4 2]